MPTSDWTPDVAAVGEILRARTKDRNSREVGTFTSDTRPTDDQVTGHISRAVGDVFSVIGKDIPADLWDDARYVAALGTAMQIELSYFPEQVGSTRSPYDHLKQLYDERVLRLKTAVETMEAGGTDPGAPLKPSFGFPMTGDPFIVGRRTAW